MNTIKEEGRKCEPKRFYGGEKEGYAEEVWKCKNCNAMAPYEHELANNPCHAVA